MANNSRPRILADMKIGKWIQVLKIFSFETKFRKIKWQNFPINRKRTVVRPFRPNMSKNELYTKIRLPVLTYENSVTSEKIIGRINMPILTNILDWPTEGWRTDR